MGLALCGVTLLKFKVQFFKSFSARLKNFVRNPSKLEAQDRFVPLFEQSILPQQENPRSHHVNLQDNDNRH